MRLLAALSAGAVGVWIAALAVSPAAASSTHASLVHASALHGADVTTTTNAVTVAPAQFGDLKAGDPLRLFLNVDDTVGTGIAAATASVSVSRTPLTSRTTLDKWFAGTSKISAADVVVQTDPLAPVLAGGSRETTLTIPATKLKFRGAGVYIVAAKVTADGQTLGTARTAVVWKSSSANAVPVTLAAPLTVPASADTLLTADELTADTAPTGILTTELEDLENTPVAIGVDPRIIASIRVLGKSAPQTALDWLTELSQVSNDTFPLAWADADITVALQAGAEKVPAHKSLDYAIDPSRFNATTTSTATPSPTPTDSTTTDFPLPTSAGLTDWNYTIPSLAWPAENTVVGSDLAKIEKSGYPASIVSSTNVRASASHTPLGSSAKVSGEQLAVSDSSISTYLRAAASASTRGEWTAAMAEVATSLDLVSTASSGTPAIVLATFGRDWASSESRFAETVTATYSRDWVTTSTLSALLAATPYSAHISNKPQDAGRISTVTDALRAERREVAFSIVVAPNQNALVSPRRLDLLSLLSVEWLDNPTGFQAQAKAFLTASHKIVSSVEPVATADFVSGSNEPSIPITIGNDLDLPITVYVEVKPTTTLLSIDPADRRIKVQIDADSQKRVQIPAQSISNGKAHVTVHLSSSNGRQIGRVNTITIDVQAGWENLGTGIFGALVVIVFGIGIIRTIRKRRRGTDDTDEPGDEGDGSARADQPTERPTA